MLETLEGYINTIIFRNEENGYTVFTLEQDGEETTCVGNFEGLRTGETVALFGHFTEHSSYGRQFRAERYEIRIPQDAAAIGRYLASGAVKGIGEALSKRIVKRFGDDTLRIMQEEPERLAEIKGISERMAREIGARIEEQSSMRDAMMFLQKYGIPLSLGIRVYREYGQEMYSILRENPYRLADEIDGIGFRTADEIAAKMGIVADAAFRIRSAILYVLQSASQEGSVYLPSGELVQRTGELLGLSDSLIDTELGNLAVERKVILAKDPDGRLIVYHSKFYYLEAETARMLADLNVICEDREDKIDKRIRRLMESAEIELEEEQYEAVRYAAKYGVTIVTGGPGTGKTTIINEILRYFGTGQYDILLAAPTGRAARRMTETTGYSASTIHRLLEIDSIGDDRTSSFRFNRNAENPLEADIIIIDEMSMVDIFLMHALLCAIPRGTRLVLTGDVDQLPSVGPGRVLRDMIGSEAFPTVRLTKIFRQAETSDIVVNAHRINRGEQPEFDNKSKDFFFLRRDDIHRTLANVTELIREKLPPYVGADPLEIQVLTPMRKGPLGVAALNLYLQNALNPQDGTKREIEHGEILFREGDKVMQIRNDYQIEWEILGKYGIALERGNGIFNGDTGFIREIDPEAKTVRVEFDEGRNVLYTAEQLGELETAYAVTIHKSQGSEYPAVILPILGGPGMLLTRNLLYTAVTRARSCVVILGREDIVRAMIDNGTEQVRYTSLDRFIRDIPSGGISI